MNDDIKDWTTDELFEEAIDWLRDAKGRDAGNMLENLSYAQEYLQTISDRCYAEICKDD